MDSNFRADNFIESLALNEKFTLPSYYTVFQTEILMAILIIEAKTKCLRTTTYP